MSRIKWEERMNKKHWEEMQKYKEFNKDNFKKIDKFSHIFSNIFNFFRYTALTICIIAIIVAGIIYLSYVIGLNSQYL